MNLLAKTPERLEAEACRSGEGTAYSDGSEEAMPEAWESLCSLWLALSCDCISKVICECSKQRMDDDDCNAT